jgi:hypothetical protein
MRQKRKTRSNKSTNGNKHSDDSFSESFKEKLKQYTKQKKIKMETSSSSDTVSQSGRGLFKNN